MAAGPQRHRRGDWHDVKMLIYSHDIEKMLSECAEHVINKCFAFAMGKEPRFFEIFYFTHYEPKER